MVRSMFSGVAGLRAHQTKMDVIGNNIANVNTYGYKSARATFKDSFYQTLTGSSEAGGAYGGGNASQIGYGSQVGSIDILFTNGGFSPTDSPTDVMINGNGFFLVGPNYGEPIDPANSKDVSKLLLTRVGMFTFDGKGNLVDANKNLVYGFKGYSAKDQAQTTGAAGAAGFIPNNTELTSPDGLIFVANAGKITLKTTTPPQAYPPGKGLADYVEAGTAGPPATNDSLKVGMIDVRELVPIKQPAAPIEGNLSSISFGKDGTISGVYDGRIITVGKLALANVPNPNALEMAQNSTYRAKENTGTIVAHPPGGGSTGLLQSGGLEMANVDLSKEFTEMITTQRGFQANTRIITVTDEMLQELVNIKR